MSKIIHFSGKKEEYYKEILIKADLGLHEQIAAIVVKSLNKGKRILDLGAGEGALSLRLKDLGFEVLAVDMDKENFKCPEIQFKQVNFDSSTEVQNFKEEYNQQFDMVIGIEVIEHVENPWEYVRTLYSFLKPDGLILITTPNITSWLSRYRFFTSGKFYQFDDANLTYGHIAPISKWELEVILRKVGFKDIITRKGGTLPPIYYMGSIKFLVVNLLLVLLRPLMKGIKDGYCIITTARKK